MGAGYAEGRLASRDLARRLTNHRTLTIESNDDPLA
jgi:hypothetical protein